MSICSAREETACGKEKWWDGRKGGSEFGKKRDVKRYEKKEEREAWATPGYWILVDISTTEWQYKRYRNRTREVHFMCLTDSSFSLTDPKRGLYKWRQRVWLILSCIQVRFIPGSFRSLNMFPHICPLTGSCGLSTTWWIVLGSFPVSGKVQPGFELSNTTNDPSHACFLWFSTA